MSIRVNKNESPIVYISLVRKGQPDLALDISKDLLGFEYTDSDRKADKCEFTINNADLSHFDKPIWKKGARLFVQWGYYGNVSRKHEVIVEKVSGFRTLKVEAHSVGVLMNKVKKSRVFKNITRSGVIHRIAGEYGFDLSHQYVDETTRIFPQITQAGVTDAQFMKKLADKEGLVFYIDADGMHWKNRDFDASPIRTYRYGAPTNLHDMVIGEPSIENDITVTRPKGVRRKGIDKESGELFDEAGSNTLTDREGMAPELDNIEDVAAQPIDVGSIEKELAGSDTAADEGLFASLEADEPASTDIPENVPEDNIIEYVDPRDKTTFEGLKGLEEGFMPVDQDTTPAQTATDAKTEADAKYKKAQQVAVKLTFTVLGDPSLEAKTVVQFLCASKRISGRYYVKEVKHTLAPGNYVTQLTTISDGGGSNQGAKSKAGSDAAVNTQPDQSTNTEGGDDAGELEPIEVVDPVTKETHIEWRKTNGKKL